MTVVCESEHKLCCSWCEQLLLQLAKSATVWAARNSSASTALYLLVWQGFRSSCNAGSPCKTQPTEFVQVPKLTQSYVTNRDFMEQYPRVLAAGKGTG